MSGHREGAVAVLPVAEGREVRPLFRASPLAVGRADSGRKAVEDAGKLTVGDGCAVLEAEREDSGLLDQGGVHRGQQDAPSGP